MRAPSGHVDEPGDAPGDCGRFLGEEEEPDQKDDREATKTTRTAHLQEKTKRLFSLSLCSSLPMTRPLEAQISEFMGGELQSDLKKTEVHQHSERGETRHGEPVSLLFLGQKERDRMRVKIPESPRHSWFAWVKITPLWRYFFKLWPKMSRYREAAR